MLGWTASGKPTRLYAPQAHVVKVLLGREEPDEAFDRFWRMRGNGKSVALVTAARYREKEMEAFDFMGGLDMEPKIYPHELHALGEREVQRIGKTDPGRIPAQFRTGDLRGAPLPPVS
jgi:hypothetical protein